MYTRNETYSPFPGVASYVELVNNIFIDEILAYSAFQFIQCLKYSISHYFFSNWLGLNRMFVTKWQKTDKNDATAQFYFESKQQLNIQ